MKELTPQKAKAHIRYKLQDGTAVPGVTTVLGILNKPALVKWANNLGLQGIDSTKYRDEMGEVGSLAHQMIASYLRGEETDTSEYSKIQIDQAENAVLSFFEWEKTHHIEPILIEEPLVSEEFGYGGTLDCLGIIHERLCLPDIKTGKAIYPEMLIQVVAYRQLVVEAVGRIPDDLMIVRVGRTPDEGFEIYYINELDKRWQIFQHCLEIYRLQKELKNG